MTVKFLSAPGMFFQTLTLQHNSSSICVSGVSLRRNLLDLQTYETHKQGMTTGVPMTETTGTEKTNSKSSTHYLNQTMNLIQSYCIV
jgi:hypothetical protein